jgi:hypothetical protein
MDRGVRASALATVGAGCWPFALFHLAWLGPLEMSGGPGDALGPHTELTEVAGNDRVVEVAVTGQRELLSGAVYDLLLQAVAALAQRCDRFPVGPDDVADLEQANRHVGDVLRVLRETELISVQHPDRRG